MLSFNRREFLMTCLRLFRGPKIVAINTNVEKVEAIRERKALKAAQLDRAIEKELLDRLAQVASDKEIYNYPESQYLKALGKAQTEDEEEEDEEELEGLFVSIFLKAHLSRGCR